MQQSRSSIRAFLLAALPFAISALPMLASASGISGVDSSEGILMPIIKVAGSIVALCIVGFAVWDYATHKHLMKAILEFVGGVVIGLCAVNADTIATMFGFTFSGSILH